MGERSGAPQLPIGLEPSAQAELQSRDIDDDLEGFYAARAALFATVESCMYGEQELIDEALYQIDLRLDETAEHFAAAACVEDGLEYRAAAAAASLHESMLELKAFLDKFDTPARIQVGDLESYSDEIEELLASADYEDHCDLLEQNFYAAHSTALRALLEYRQEDATDLAGQLSAHRLRIVSSEIVKALVTIAKIRG